MQKEKDSQGNEGELRLQRDVLALVLVEHPLQLTLAEVQKATGGSFELERAVAALVADKLLALEGENVSATPAAVRFNQLEPIRPPHPSH
ncbi:MAG TPA: hypothetical protein VGI73_12450 [Solirubrobacterales bacterium]|jgi:hypothetical protein